MKIPFAICKDSATACSAGISTLWQWSLTWIALSDASFSWLYWAMLTLGLQVTKHSSDITHTLWYICDWLHVSMLNKYMMFRHKKRSKTTCFGSEGIRSSKAGKNGQLCGRKKPVTYCDHMTSLSTLPSVWSEEPLDSEEMKISGQVPDNMTILTHSTTR